MKMHATLIIDRKITGAMVNAIKLIANAIVMVTEQIDQKTTMATNQSKHKFQSQRRSWAKT